MLKINKKRFLISYHLSKDMHKTKKCLLITQVEYHVRSHMNSTYHFICYNTKSDLIQYHRQNSKLHNLSHIQPFYHLITDKRIVTVSVTICKDNGIDGVKKKGEEYTQLGKTLHYSAEANKVRVTDKLRKQINQTSVHSFS